MKKAIAILLVAIVALGCVFADVKTAEASTTDDLKVKYQVSATNTLFWSGSEVESTTAPSTDLTEETYSGATTYYATLITNSKNNVTLSVSGTAFKNDDTAVGNAIKTTYTINGGTATTVDDDDSASGFYKESGESKDKVLRVVTCPVLIAMDETSKAAAPAGNYTATLTATVSAI